MRIALSGSSGFIGSHLLEILKADSLNEVYLLKWQRDKWFLLEGNGSGGYYPSLAPLEVDLVILAGSSMPKNRLELDDLDAAYENVTSAIEFSKMEILGRPRIVYLSTTDVYGFDEPVSEHSSLNPASLYALSKLFSERLLKKFSEKVNYDLTILRIGHVFGPGERAFEKVIPSMMRSSLDRGELEVFGSGYEHRSFLFVKDLVGMVSQLIHRAVAPKLINIVGSESISIRELAEVISEITPNGSAITFTSELDTPKDQLFDKSLMLGFFAEKQTPLKEALREALDSLKI